MLLLIRMVSLWLTMPIVFKTLFNKRSAQGMGGAYQGKPLSTIALILRARGYPRRDSVQGIARGLLRTPDTWHHVTQTARKPNHCTIATASLLNFFQFFRRLLYICWWKPHSNIPKGSHLWFGAVPWTGTQGKFQLTKISTRSPKKAKHTIFISRMVIAFYRIGQSKTVFIENSFHQVFLYKTRNFVYQIMYGYII